MSKSGSSQSGNRSGRLTYRDYLAERRQRAHDEAAADATQHESGQIPEHPLICADEPEWIDTNAQVSTLVDRLRDAEVFAYDTEFIGETYYPPKLCLIQFATPGGVMLVDPLAEGLDLTPLWRLMVDPAVSVVVHAGQPDMGPIVRYTDMAPARLYDTQLAAGVVGQTYPMSLAGAAEAFLGVQLPKSLTFTQWDERPLSDVHRRYAADDVRYLLAIRAELDERLERMNRQRWAEQMFDDMREPGQYRFDAVAQARRVLRQGSLPPRAFVTLVELVKVREQGAVAKCLPPRAVMRNTVLVELARHRPNSISGLRKLGLGKNQIDAYGEALLHAITVARAIPRDELPRRHNPLSPAQRDAVDRIWKKLKAWADENELPLQLLTNRKGFTSYARDRLRDDDLDGYALSHGWRREMVAAKLDEWFEDR